MKNEKRTSCFPLLNSLSFFIFHFSFFIASLLFLQPLSEARWSSPLDTEASYVSITGPEGFSCLGLSPPGPTDPLDMTFAALEIDEVQQLVTLTNCFQLQGRYDLLIHIEDEAGNVVEESYNFWVRSSAPDPTKTVITQTSFPETPTANGEDYYEFSLTLRDALGNQIEGLNQMKVYAPRPIPDPYPEDPLDDAYLIQGDANRGVSFREGLRIGNDPVPETVPTVANMTYDTENGSGTFRLTALAPSLLQLGTDLAYQSPREMTLVFAYPKVELDGTVSATEFSTVTHQAQVQFDPLFIMTPTLPEHIFAGQPFTVDIGIQERGAGVGITPPDIQKARVLSTAPMAFSNVDLDGEGYDFVDQLNLVRGDIGASVGIISHALGNVGESVNIHTEIEYLMGGQTVRYRTGFAGDMDYEVLGIPDDPNTQEDVNTIIDPHNPHGGIIGANIGGRELGTQRAFFESPVIMDQGRFVLQEDQLSEEILFEDRLETLQNIRRSMRHQAFDKVQGATRIDCPTGERDFADIAPSFVGEQSSVFLENCHVRLGGSNPITFPSGRHTLLLRNGNVLIDQDLQYAGATKHEDSFGFLLFNDVITPYPGVGNIFIRHNVEQMVGTYYLDGGFVSYKGDPVPTDFDPLLDASVITNALTPSSTPEDLNRRQLILRGSFVSYNTMGGFYLKHHNPDEAAQYYFTPWERLEDGTAADQALAIKYDLHYLRRYNPADLEDHPDWCALDLEDPTACDRNPNAFVIRNDHKGTTFPPPGFEELEVWDVAP